MKFKFYALLAIVVGMFILGLTTAHAQSNTATNKPVLCIGSEQHQIYTGTETEEMSGGASIYSCLNMAQNNASASACDLDSPGFKKCLQANADSLVKMNKPKAYRVFRLYVTVDGKEQHVDILTPKNGAISGSFNGITFSLKSMAESNGITEVTYTIDQVKGGYRFDRYDWVAAGDRSVLQML
jgi:hypothetical protein